MDVHFRRKFKEWFKDDFILRSRFQFKPVHSMMINKHTILLLKTCLFYLGCFSQTPKDTSIVFYFETNSSQLDSNQFRSLSDFASAFHIQVIKGYADTTGAKEYNISLSKKRAVAVYKALTTNSASADKIDLFYLGESTAAPELWKNRRVEVVARPTPSNEAVYQVPLHNATTDTTVQTPGIPRVVQTFYLDNVYFIPDHAIITEESLSYIEELAALLKNYETEKFEIIGHINYQSRFDSSHLTDLYQLSEKRAKTIYDILVEQGIPANRMSYKGVGNSQPTYPEPVNDEQRRKNMRVQIVIKK